MARLVHARRSDSAESHRSPCEPMSAEDPLLFTRYPQLRERVGWLPLGRFPTPLQRLTVSGGASEVWIKRDDLSGNPYGGNKVRKLEFILGEARRRGAGRLITGGAAGSHHALATTIYGRSLGLEVSLFLFPQPLTEHVREVLLQDAAHGASLHWLPRMELIPIALRLALLAYRGEHPMLIAPGGSDRFGTLGYVNAALELAQQIEAGDLPQPAEIHVAAGTLGTAAGLALGFALLKSPVRITATRVIGRLVANRWALRSRIRDAARTLGSAGVDTRDALRHAMRHTRLVGTHLGRGYGHATPEGEAAMRELGAAGIQLDPTYTGKAAAALLQGIRTARGGPVLFWQTLSVSEPGILGTEPDPGILPPKIRGYLRSTGAPARQR
jgi:1-aminocyclopropane-1-carboxylate deaminase/D-cysteine desulfhydrase-like pyridoxal-dependent ACC family enzyme